MRLSRAWPSTEPSRTAEPVVALVLPIAARVLVRDFDGNDVLRILVAELGRHAQLHRKAVFGWQHVAVVREREQCLRVQRSWHVDAGPVVVRATQRYIFRARIRTRTPQKIREANAAPMTDCAPSFDADMPRNLAFL